jgi:hypothetical protein
MSLNDLADDFLAFLRKVFANLRREQHLGKTTEMEIIPLEGSENPFSR